MREGEPSGNVTCGKLFHNDGGGNTTFHTQFCEISERKDAVHDFFERFLLYALIGETGFVYIVTPQQKTQLLYNRRERKGMRISGIDSLAELWDWDDSGARIIGSIPEGKRSEFIWKSDLVEGVRNEGGTVGEIRLISNSIAYNNVKNFVGDVRHVQMSQNPRPVSEGYLV